MNTNMRISAGLALRYAVALVVGLLSVASLGRVAAAQVTGPSAAVRTFLESINTGDLSAMLATVDPNGEYISGPGAPDEARDTLKGFLEGVASQRFKVTILDISDTGPDTATATFEVAGGDIPPLPHPFTLVGTFTVKDGKVVKMVEEFTPQTAADLAALESASVGMPATGDPGPFPAVIVLLSTASVLILVGGVSLLVLNKARRA